MQPRGGSSHQNPLPQRRITRKRTVGNLGASVFDSEAVPSSIVEIVPILRVADEVEPGNPRVAYLCRFYAFEVAHRLDPTCIGRGVTLFKTALLKCLERENETTLMRRVKSDAHEMKCFYEHYYKEHIQPLQNAADKADRAQFTKVHQTANILFEVLKAAHGGVDVDREILEAHAPYKILRLEPEAVPPSMVEIAPILRVADEVESSNPRVAYLCRFYAFEKAHRLDPTASGRGVREFKTALIKRIERENEATLMGRAKSDAHEMKCFYECYYKEYMQALQNAANKADRSQLTKAHQTANILFEVLRAFNLSQAGEDDCELLEAHDEVAEEDIYADSANQAIMQNPEIRAAVHALRNIRGLPWPKDHKKKKDEDILDWLQAMFGFKKDNVANQRGHLILLLANVHILPFPKPDQQPKLDVPALNEAMKKLFKNYKKWCKYLHRKNSLWLPTIQQEVQQRKLLYMGLYLLIWGEAGNLRFMPECLCYFYHHMAFELHGMLSGSVSPMTGENVKPAYGGEEGAFLQKVVTPINEVIARETARRRNGKSKHSEPRIYDDLNEYFWSADCFRLGWPMWADADFFCKPLDLLVNERKWCVRYAHCLRRFCH